MQGALKDPGSGGKEDKQGIAGEDQSNYEEKAIPVLKRK
jgi:hypothetical protein